MSTTGTKSVGEEFAERIAEQEQRLLSPLAARSYPALREHAEEDCSLRTPFQRDRDRIVHCKAFRRLTHKTQVFVAPRGDHYRTRLTHTLEVTTISRTVARALRLNEDLVEAIGLGHDLGHPPFGHIGEEVLDRCLRERFGRGFRHYEHSLRIVERLERDGSLRGSCRRAQPDRAGARRDRAALQPGAELPETLEGRIVRVIDRVAYINHDIDDAVRAGLLSEGELPRRADRGARAQRLGADRHARARHGRALRAGGRHRPGAGGGPGDGRAARLHVRAGVPRAGGARRAREDRGGAGPAVRALRRAPGAAGGPPDVPVGASAREAEEALAQRVTDYIAGMTDRYCIREYTELQVPRAFAR